MVTEGKRWRYRADEVAPGPPSRRHLSRSDVRRLLEREHLPATVQERLTDHIRQSAVAFVQGHPVGYEVRTELLEILADLAKADRPSPETLIRILDEDPFRWRLLEELVRARFLTLDQAAHLVYLNAGGAPPTGHMVAGRWLKRFFSWGLARPFTPTRSLTTGRAAPQGGGSERLIYTAEHLGARLVATRLQQRLSSIWWPAAPHLSMQAVPHRLQIIDFYVALRYWLAQVGGQLETWEIERRYQFGKTILAPDAFADVWIADQQHQLFIEVDRGSEGPVQFTKRMSTYNAAAKTDEWKERFGENRAAWPVVLVIVAAVRERVGQQQQEVEERAFGLKQAVEEADGGRWVFPRFKFVPGPAVTYLVPQSQVVPGSRSQTVRLYPVQVRFNEPLCWVLRKPDDELRPVLKGGI